MTGSLRVLLVACAVVALAACGGGGSAPAGDVAVGAASRGVAALPLCSPPASTLYDITTVQGPGPLSPLQDQPATVRGVLTADFRGAGRLGGFYLQQPDPDNDRATSEGIFVFAPADTTPLAVGDFVQVSGVVREFKSGSLDPDRLTQIADVVAVQRCGDATPIKAKNVTLPVQDLAELEALEGMLVRFEQPLFVSEVFSLGRFGELLLTPQSRLFHPNNHPRFDAERARDLNRRSRLVLDDGLSRQNPNPIPYLSEAGSDGTRRLGDSVKGTEGVLTWGFDAWRVQPTVMPAFAPANPRPAAPPAIGGTLRVASLNVLNYFTTLNQRGANSPAELVRQRDKLVATIKGLDADVLGLIEIENNDRTALADLVAAVNAQLGAPVYQLTSAGVPGTDQIKVALIYKPARVTAIGNPVVPDDADFVVDGGLRPPVAQRFRAANGGGVWVVVTHHKSKGSCPVDPASVDADRGQGCWNVARVRQTEALKRFAAQLVAVSGEADVLHVGDFNAYLNEDPIVAMEAGGYETLLKRLPPEARYSYVFFGETGALDHAFASPSLAGQVTGVGVWHVNADEPPVLDYNTEFKTDDRYAATPYRSSDHDPVLVGLALVPDPPAAAPTLVATLPAAGQAGLAVAVTDIVATPSAPGATATLSVDWGDGTIEQLPPGATAATHVYAAAGTFRIRLAFAELGQIPAVLQAPVVVSPAPDPGTLPEVFISEYIEGSSFNKAIELYNPTSTAVDLSRYAVRLYSNGAATPSQSVTLSGSLMAGATYVICNSQIAAAAQGSCNLFSNSVINFNGDDAITVERDGTVVDAFGQTGFDPGTAWTAGGLSTVDRTLRRKPGIVRGSVPPASPAAWDLTLEWEGLPVNTLDGLGAR